MERSLLNRLPDIMALARQRARELSAPPARSTTPARLRQHPGWPVAQVRPAPDDHRQVTLLCGDELTVMAGLLTGQARPDGAMAGRVALVWLPADADVPADSADPPLSAVQVRVRHLIDLSTRLFLARSLLRDGGRLVVSATDDPDRCTERLMAGVFDDVRRLGPRDRFAHAPALYLAGPDMPAPSLSPEHLVRDGSRRGDTVLVLRAGVCSAQWVAALDRNWVLVQPEPLGFALLREHIVARQMGQKRWRIVSEDRRAWAEA